MTHQDKGSVALGVVFGLITALIWGAWPVISGLALEQKLNAYDVTALRFGVSGMVLLPYLLKRGLKGAHWQAIVLMVCGAGAPYVLLAVWGLGFAPAGHFGVVTPSCMLISASIGGWLVLGDRPGMNRLIGLGGIIVGVSLIGWEGLTLGGPQAWKGELIFMGCGLLWATYTVSSRAYKVEPLYATALVSVTSMFLYLPFYFFSGVSNLWEASLLEVTTQGLFHGILTAIVGLLCYTRCVAILGAGRGAAFAALVPGVALILAYPILGEVPHLRAILGLIAVTGGMIYSIKPSKTSIQGRGDAPSEVFGSNN